MLRYLALNTAEVPLPVTVYKQLPNKLSTFGLKSTCELCNIITFCI